MLFALLGLILVIISCRVVASQRQQQMPDTTALYKSEGMHFTLPLRGHVVLNSESLVQSSINLWGSREHYSGWRWMISLVMRGSAAYAVTDLANWAVLKVVDAPMPARTDRAHHRRAYPANPRSTAGIAHPCRNTGGGSRLWAENSVLRARLPQGYCSCSS